MAKKKMNKKQLSTSERRFGVVLEDIDSKLDLVLEGHQALDADFSKKFDKVDEKLEDIDGKINIHTGILNSHTKTLASHTEILNSHTKTLASHTEIIGGMAADVEIIKSDAEFIKNSLKKKVDVDEFAFLEKE